MKKQTLAIISGLFLTLLFIVIVQIFVNREANFPPPSSKTQEFLPPEKNIPTVVPTKSPENKEMTLIIDFGNGTRLVDKSSGATVYEATVNFLKAKGTKFEEKEYKFGKMIEKIGNFGNSQTGYWVFFVNNKSGRVAADKTAIYPGDVIEWKYQKQ